MYIYQEHDYAAVEKRVSQFADQTKRYLSGQIKDEEFLPLRLQNGLYIQRLAPMLRICVPYGLISSVQLRTLAQIARDFDKGYAHLTTRQNIQLNWPHLEDVPELLGELAKVGMHAIQTSGNCIRNFTTSQYAGNDATEIANPLIWCEILRQWASLHPEFSYLPRKFKIAINASSEHDYAATRFHDIGLQLKEHQGKIGFEIFVGGGLGRTPVISSSIFSFVPEQEIIGYLNSILRVYNLKGRRDNKYKARIKILVKSMGVNAFRHAVEEQRKIIPTPDLTPEEITSISLRFSNHQYKPLCPAVEQTLQEQLKDDTNFARWYNVNTLANKYLGYRCVTLTIKQTHRPAGDLSSEELEVIANLTDTYSMSEARFTHEQNITFAQVHNKDLFTLYEKLSEHGLADPILNHLRDAICCPGGDFCSLANAKSIPTTEAIQQKFDDLDYLYNLGKISLKVSGCMNACGHHHIGNIGILGVDKKGEEWFQISLGGDSGNNARIARILGPSFSREQIPEIIEKIIDCYLDNRQPEESFIDCFYRIDVKPFKERVYAQ